MRLAEPWQGLQVTAVPLLPTHGRRSGTAAARALCDMMLQVLAQVRGSFPPLQGSWPRRKPASAAAGGLWLLLAVLPCCVRLLATWWPGRSVVSAVPLRHAGPAADVMGFVVENRLTVAAIHERLKGSSTVQVGRPQDAGQLARWAHCGACDAAV